MAKFFGDLAQHLLHHAQPRQGDLESAIQFLINRSPRPSFAVLHTGELRLSTDAHVALQEWQNKRIVYRAYLEGFKHARNFCEDVRLEDLDEEIEEGFDSFKAAYFPNAE
jgi:hypothetical protein